MIGTTDTLTPSVKRLLIEFMAKRQVDRAKRKAEPGPFGIVSAVAADLAENGLKLDAKEALADVNAALRALRSAAEPNQFKASSDEEIATAILDRLKAKRSGARA